MSIFALAYTDKIEPYFEQAMSSVIDSYATSNATRDGFNFIQTDLQCCGVWNTTDWSNSQTWLDQVNATLGTVKKLIKTYYFYHLLTW